MISTEEIRKRKSQLENALNDVNLALNHPEYKEPFHFKRQDTIKPEALSHPVLKKIMDKCISNGSGFDPNLISQHLEQEALNQFNEIVISSIKGKSIKELMEIRHEIELLMLKDREEHYTNEILKINKMLIESTTGVEAAPIEKVTKIDRRRKGNK